MSETLPRRFVLKGRYVFPVASGAVADGFVAVEGEQIASVGRDPPARSAGVEVFDLGNAAILPGLVNAHVHLDFSDLAAPLGRRGIGLVDWIRLVIEHRRQTTKPVEEIIALGIAESVRCGVTTFGDIVQPNQPPVGSPLEATVFLELKAIGADRVAGAVELARAHLKCDFPAAGECRQNGPLSILERVMAPSPPAPLPKGEGRIVPGLSPIPGLGPHAPYTVHPELLKAVVELSAAARAPVAMHLAESPEEIEFLRTGGGAFRTFLEGLGYGPSEGTIASHFARPMDYLRLMSAADRALVVHGNYLDDEEIAHLGANAARMSVVYCPRSHDWFAHAEYPLRKMLSAGATVALGTDGRCSAPDLSLLEEMRFVVRRHPDVRPARILRMGTLDGARALGREDEIGSLSPGKRADLAIVALPDRDAADPHELLFDSSEPVVGCYCRGAAVGNCVAGYF